MNTKSEILNPELARAVAAAGHFDELVIADCGLPIPSGPMIIDLSVMRGLPSFKDVWSVIMSELAVERVIVATEIQQNNPEVFNLIQSGISKKLDDGAKIECDAVAHEDFKLRCAKAKWIVRTGENTPYANAILVAGVAF
jgi:D-ribose pyranase